MWARGSPPKLRGRGKWAHNSQLVHEELDDGGASSRRAARLASLAEPSVVPPEPFVEELLFGEAIQQGRRYLHPI